MAAELIGEGPGGLRPREPRGEVIQGDRALAGASCLLKPHPNASANTEPLLFGVGEAKEYPRRVHQRPDGMDDQLAKLLNVKPRCLLTQLAEWTRLGFLIRTSAGTYALDTPP